MLTMPHEVKLERGCSKMEKMGSGKTARKRASKHKKPARCLCGRVLECCQVAIGNSMCQCGEFKGHCGVN